MKKSCMYLLEMLDIIKLRYDILQAKRHVRKTNIRIGLETWHHWHAGSESSQITRRRLDEVTTLSPLRSVDFADAQAHMFLNSVVKAMCWFSSRLTNLLNFPLFIL